MDVELPSSGCNIINSSTSFYNYSTDGRTRELYYIVDGKALLGNTQTSQYGFSYSGDCLSTGDIIYHPEIKVAFPIISAILFFFIVKFIFRLFRGRL